MLYLGQIEVRERGLHPRIGPLRLVPVTATRERQSAPAVMPGEPSWAERSAFGTTRGVPLWGALLLAILPTAFGSALDQMLAKQSGILTTVCFVVACLLAVAMVQRRSVFGPMVQTPLVVSIVLPLVALLTDSSKGGGSGKVFTIAKPLINNFPMTAITAVLALGIGLLRMYYLQPARDEPADESGMRPSRSPRSGANAVRGRAAESGGAPAEGRRPNTGPRPDERGRRPDSRGQRRPDGRGQQRPDDPREQQRRPGRGEPNRGEPGRGNQPERGRGGPPPERGQPNRGGQPGREGQPSRGAQQRRQPPPDGGRGRPPREQQPGKPPRGERQPRPDSGERRGNPPPGREGRGRQQPPGRGRPADPRGGNEQPPPRRPRKPKRNDFWD